MIGKGDRVYMLYQTDKWHTYDSRVLFATGETEEECINMLWNKYGEEQTEHSVLINEQMRDELLAFSQTQNSKFDYEFDIDYIVVGEMYE